MKRFIDELADLVREIVKGKCSVDQAKAELHRIEEAYPDERFLDIVPERKDKPWSMAYLKDLKELFFYGSVSKDYILYMAEVSEEVYRIKKIKKILLSVFITVVMVVCCVLFIKQK